MRVTTACTAKIYIWDESIISEAPSVVKCDSAPCVILWWPVINSNSPITKLSTPTTRGEAMRSCVFELRGTVAQWHKGKRILLYRWQNTWLDLLWNPYCFFWRKAHSYNSTKALECLLLFTCNSKRCPQRAGTCFAIIVLSGARHRGTMAQWHFNDHRSSNETRRAAQWKLWRMRPAPHKKNYD